MAAVGAFDRVVARAGKIPDGLYDARTTAAAAAIPSIGDENGQGTAQVSQEEVIAQRPDLVIGYETDTIKRAALAAAGIPMLIEPAFCTDKSQIPGNPNLDDVYARVEFWGQVFGKPDAASASAADLRRRVAAVRAKASAGPSRAGATLFVSLGGGHDVHPLSQLHMGPAKDAWAAIWEAALPTAPADVLDVGTGTGQVALLLAELGHRVTGIDLAPNMLGLARVKSQGMANPPTLLAGDAVAPDFPGATFDAVTCRYLLRTLREPGLALANWRRLIRPGGTFVAVDSTWWPRGLRVGTSAYQDRDEFLTLYDDAVVAALPLAEATTIEQATALVRDVGYGDVQVTPLPEIERLERALLAEPDPTVRLQFMVTGRAWRPQRPGLAGITRRYSEQRTGTVTGYGTGGGPG